MTSRDVEKYPVNVIKGLRVRMRDGVELNVRITRPATEGRFPAVLEYNPYRRLDHVNPSFPPAVAYLAERGYAVVQFDVRGTGSSSGASLDAYSDDEQQDGYDMVEWAARQPWCTGAVGMIGKSYGATVQWQVAGKAPPHLKAIIIRSGSNDMYEDTAYPGGCRRPWRFEFFAPNMNAYNFAPPDPHLTGPDWSRIWNERLDGSQPWSLNIFRHDTDGEYWRGKSINGNFENVGCAVYLIEGWADWYANAELDAFRQLNGAKKVVIGPWGHYYPEEKFAFPGPRIDTRVEYLRWFDHWLKGIDNGIMDEPPVTVFVRKWQQPSLLALTEPGHWHADTNWPPAASSTETLYFDHTVESLSRQAPTDGTVSYDYRPTVGMASGRVGLGSTSPWGMPTDQRIDDAFSACFTTPPLDGAMALLGQPEAVLYVSSSAEVAYFHVRICDVASDGTSRLLSHGGRLATHRQTHDRPTPLEPGKIYELRLKLRDLAYEIAPGHRLRIAVSSADFQNAWPTGMPARNTIHCGAAHPSRIELPIMQATGDRQEPPAFEPSPFALPSEAEIPKATYTLAHDLVSDSVVCTLGASGDGGSRRSDYTVSNRDPAQASIISEVRYRAPHPNMAIDVESSCQTTSTGSEFTHAVQVSIRIDDRVHFQKSWVESVPRNHS
ncbi:MAG TPA: CocE/NonD family hydrolase [Bordetella sp.]|nr:CocE/NonD family hydrolase [Bordetella sp.]